MAVAFVQFLGAVDSGTLGTSLVLSISKTVTVGNTIIVGGAYFAAPGAHSMTDNLGNVYTARAIGGDGTHVIVLFSAPVTVGGTLTTVTLTHPSATFRGVSAAEFSGVGDFNADPGATAGVSTTATWMPSGTIPGNGVAVGFFTQNLDNPVTAGANSGTPSTTIVLDNHAGDGANISLNYLHAIAVDDRDVTGFVGTATFASDSWRAVGGTFRPALASATYPVRIANRSVGPAVLRYRFRQPFLYPADSSGAAPAFDPATGFPWDPPADDLSTGQGYDPTEQSWTIQPPAVAAYDPATGFPWPPDDSQPQAVVVFDTSEQAWAVTAPPFVPAGADDLALFPLAFDDTVQSWTIQPPAVAAFDPAAGFPWNPPADDAVIPSGYDSTDQAWAVQPVAPPFDPASGYGWTSEDSRPLPAGYDATEQAWAVQVVGAAPAFDPSTGFPWNDPGPDVIAQPVWTDDAGTVLPVTPFIGNEPGTDPQARVWFDPSEQSYTIQPPLDVASLGGLWTSADPTQDRSFQPVWYDPEPGTSWAAPLGVGAGNVGIVPGGFASSMLAGGVVNEVIPSGSASRLTPGGTANRVVPGGDVTREE
jgi:hypothetical protein